MTGMIRERVVGLLKGAAEVNLRYSAMTLRLAREYIKEFDALLREPSGNSGPDAQPEPQTEAAPQAEAAPPPRPPILLAGSAGAEAGGVFMLSNGADFELPVQLLVQDYDGPAPPTLTPASFTMAPRAMAAVQLGLRIGEDLEIGRDYRGTVVAPSLSAPPVEFIVRRMADEAAPSAESPQKAKRKRAP
jgi:hypothetical protein